MADEINTWLGIIPADAGSTVADNDGQLGKEDHPRGCGEHARQASTGPLSAGSSPRMRGARGTDARTGHERRIIPADAGSTRSDPGSMRTPRDHPRGCGEHGVGADAVYRVEGSSPRMRGAPGFGRSWPIWRGIIPADAGSTQRQGLDRPSLKDHPRGCGEHL